ncbi:MAG: hypothetical protein M0C28_37075 [Candidatus Moduliflexus flocculans]|nr:hypothetical protein [Candidatus Moduliflexus flocculans]
MRRIALATGNAKDLVALKSSLRALAGAAGSCWPDCRRTAAAPSCARQLDPLTRRGRH